MVLEIIQNHSGLYMFGHGDIIYFDDQVYLYTGLTLYEYRHYLKKHHNAKDYGKYDISSFEKIEDATAAFEWYSAMYIAQKLIGG